MIKESYQEAEAQILRKDSKPISNFSFKQQLLGAWKPKPTIVCAIIIYSIIGVVFLVLGIIIYLASIQISEFEMRYENKCSIDQHNPCTMSFTLDSAVKAPIFFYYRITDFYQNHRRYISSMDKTQLRGLESTTFTTNCQGALYNKDFPFIDAAYKSVGGGTLNPDDYANPCGMAARSYFNDTFVIRDPNGKQVDIIDKDIAWLDDKIHRFKNSDLNKQWINIESERFMNWMKIAPFSNVRKTWGRINNDLEKGTYSIEIKNLWNSSLFGGKKFWGITTTNVFGGENRFLGISYIVVGSISIVIAIIFSIRKGQRPQGILDQKLKEANVQVKKGNKYT